MNRTLARLLLLLLFPATLFAGGYRLELEANPAAPFPFLSKFGAVEIAVYPGGVAAKAPLLRAFSRTGDGHVTVMSPLSRLYADVALSKVRAMMLTLARAEGEVMPGLGEFPVSAPAKGKVGGLEALRYRIELGPESSMDVWTTTAIPNNAQYRKLALEFAATISKPAAAMVSRFAGMPIYVELNTIHYKKVALLKVKGFKGTSAGEDDDLTVGRLYVKAPGADAILGE
jgi:hypothetical protein